MIEIIFSGFASASAIASAIFAYRANKNATKANANAREANDIAQKANTIANEAKELQVWVSGTALTGTVSTDFKSREPEESDNNTQPEQVPNTDTSIFITIHLEIKVFSGDLRTAQIFFNEETSYKLSPSGRFELHTEMNNQSHFFYFPVIAVDASGKQSKYVLFLLRDSGIFNFAIDRGHTQQTNSIGMTYLTKFVNFDDLNSKNLFGEKEKQFMKDSFSELESLDVKDVEKAVYTASSKLLS